MALSSFEPEDRVLLSPQLAKPSLAVTLDSQRVLASWGRNSFLLGLGWYGSAHAVEAAAIHVRANRVEEGTCPVFCPAIYFMP